MAAAFLGLILMDAGGAGRCPAIAPAAVFAQDDPIIEILDHEWHPDEVWEKIGKTKYFWSATVRNNSDTPKRVDVYYSLVDATDTPLARNATNRSIGPHETVEITSDSYITTKVLPLIKSSRVSVKVRRPNK